MDFNSIFSSVFNDGKSSSMLHPIGCHCYICSFKGTSFTFTGPTTDFFLQLELPGVKRKDISVKLKGCNLNITYTSRLGELKAYSYVVGDKYYEQEKLSCKYEDGLLTVTAPLKKKEPEVPTQEPETVIDIK